MSIEIMYYFLLALGFTSLMLFCFKIGRLLTIFVWWMVVDVIHFYKDALRVGNKKRHIILCIYIVAFRSIKDTFENLRMGWDRVS